MAVRPVDVRSRSRLPGSLKGDAARLLLREWLQHHGRGVPELHSCLPGRCARLTLLHESEGPFANAIRFSGFHSVSDDDKTLRKKSAGVGVRLLGERLGQQAHRVSRG